MNSISHHRTLHLFLAIVLSVLSASATALDSIALEFGSAASDEDAERYGFALKWDWAAQ